MATMQLVWTLTGPGDAVPARAPDEACLVAAAQKGDRDAFTELVRRNQRRVFRLAGRFFRQRADVEDAAQETFLRAWRRLDTYRERAPFEHWLTRLCLNCCYALLRTRKETVPLPGNEPAVHGDPDAALEVRGLLSRLPPADRFLILLLEGEGWAVEEVAGRLGWSQVNVRVRAHRARKRLRRLLEEGGAP
jgi:RNA polymerase sigma-70 factor (ECF subfamily)